MIENIIATLILVLILGSAITYIVMAKKKGRKCIGCRHSKTCGSKQNGCRCSNLKDKNK